MQDAYRGGDREAYRGGDGGPINTICIRTDNKTLNVLHTYKEPMQDVYRGGNREAYIEAAMEGLLSRFELALTTRH